LGKARKSERKAGGERESFEQVLGKLEEVVEQLEEGRLGLSDSLLRYEEGVKRLKQCYQLLQEAERKIELLAGVDSEGNPVCEPFQETEMSLDEKKQSRSRRRTRPNAGRSASSEPDDAVDMQGGLF
jgi:exodeoxyribonuclease VII small subunit